MTYVLHYTSADGPGPGATWSVYREEYVDSDAVEPIEGTTRKISTHPTELAAGEESHRLQTFTPDLTDADALERWLET